MNVSAVSACLLCVLVLDSGCATTTTTTVSTSSKGPPRDARSHDIVIYGGTSAAIASAIQAQRMGRSVILVSPDKHLGGLTSGGLGWTDSGNKRVVGGIAREFYARVKQHYDLPTSWTYQKPEDYEQYRKNEGTMWVFEPHVAEAIYDAWLKDIGITVVRSAWLDRERGVAKDGPRITSITTLDGKTYAGRMFIDATYEGDLMAAAGVSYAVGREPNAQYGETINGIQVARAHSHQFSTKIDPYVVPGDPASGLLPRISNQDPGNDGEGDRRIQAYNFRTCLTNVEANRKPFPKPEGYDARQYELLLRTLLAGSRHVFGKFDPAPNGKTDTNNHGSFSTDNIGMNYDYPDASYKRRREIIKEHERYQQGFYYFLCNDPRVPQDVRTRMSTWGLSKDEFKDNGNWPHQIYVREARRMIGKGVITELHLRLVKPTDDSVGMGSYNMDSHNTQRFVAHDETGKPYVRNEGDLQLSPGGPYPISYKAIVPKAGECDNLIVPVACSASHIAYGSIRMEPVFMVLGQSATTAAALAMDAGTRVQDVPYAKLRERLLADKQVLTFDRPPLMKVPDRAKAEAVDPVSLPGVVIDDEHAILTGDWQSAAALASFVGHGAVHDGGGGKGNRSARFITTLKRGRYDVRLAYMPANNRATNVPVIVRHAGGEATVTVDERKTPPIDKLWISLGTYEFSDAQPAEVEVRNAGANGHVILDAVQFLPESK